mmetsp:Transcript_14101/g.51195  ORF Transcript_14101/g.51195 Transcript_14101/m.51195 type:complete len:223 (-) Transcript_14101:112-780(-)
MKDSVQNLRWYTWSAWLFFGSFQNTSVQSRYRMANWSRPRSSTSHECMFSMGLYSFVGMGSYSSGTCMYLSYCAIVLTVKTWFLSSLYPCVCSTAAAASCGVENSMRAKPWDLFSASSNGMISPPSRMVPICEKSLLRTVDSFSNFSFGTTGMLSTRMKHSKPLSDSTSSTWLSKSSSLGMPMSSPGGSSSSSRSMLDGSNCSNSITAAAVGTSVAIMSRNS